MGKRGNIFTRHPKGKEIFEKLINRRMGPSEAARLLGTSPQNVHNHLKKHGLKPKRTQESYSPLEQAKDQLATMAKMSFDIGGTTDQETTTAIGWKVLQQGLLKLLDADITAGEFVQVANSLRRMFEFAIQKEVPEIKMSEPLVIDKESEDRIIKRVGDYCEHCPYRAAFDKKKAREQDKFRLESRQSPSLG